MAEAFASGWLVEQGIGEERAILYKNGQPIAARARWPGGLEPGQIMQGNLASRTKGSSRGRAQFPDGEQALVEKLPREASEGASLRFLITRAAMGETNRVKLAQARPTEEAARAAPTLAERLADARIVPAFPTADWDDIHASATDGIIPFAGGSLHFAPTPAMVVVDIDGHLPPRDLALAAVEPLARAMALFALGGMVGIDFPTIETKADRKAVDAALADALVDFDHERTAMNGFGLVQIISRSERPSMLHLAHYDKAGAAARLLLRRAQQLEGAGMIELTAHPTVLARLTEDWLTQLRRHTGKELSMRPDPGLALEAPHAQLVPR